MINETQYYGGSKRNTSSASLQFYRHEARLRVINCTTAGHAVILPEASSFLINELGAEWMVYNESTSSQNIVVKATINGSLSTLCTLTPGQVAVCFLINHTAGAEKWIAAVRTRNTARTAAVGSHTGPTKHDPTTYTPSCFEGELCDFAEAEGNVPLDGQDTRPEVIAPMIQDVIANAINAAREPIRAADYVMPSIVLLTFRSGHFTPDANHPWAGSYTLSPEFYTALENNNRPHAVEYDNTADGLSHHWHHARWAGGVPSWGIDPAFSVKRFIWKKIIPYFPNGGATQRNLEIRFVMEHTVDPTPTLTPSGSGGQQSRTEGAWGAVFHVYVFTDELNPSFVDGNSYTPVGATGTVAFTKNNPCLYGGTGAIYAGDDADRFIHPQMAICAHIPTSFESPAEYDWIPPEERDYFQGIEGNNRSCWYKVSNGAPWLPGGCTEAAAGGIGIEGNCVFGYSITTNSFAAYTLGGDFPTSKPLEFVTIENGLGVGRTYLKPKYPGWDEVCGRLNATDGSSISIKLCSDDKYWDGGWPKYDFDSCIGHPDEPFEGYGGSHSCFNRGNTTVPCCVEFADAICFANEICTLTQTKYGDFNGTDCNVIEQVCYVQGTYNTSILCSVYDYDYYFNGNYLLRQITWKGFKLIPNAERFDFTYAGASSALLVTKRGTFTYGATIDVTVAAGAGTHRSIALHEPSTAIKHGQVYVKATKCTTQPHSLFFKASYTAGALTAYELRVTPTGGSNATVALYKIIADVATQLWTTNITNVIASMGLRATWWGCDLTVWWDYDRNTALSHSREDTAIDGSGVSGFGSTANSTSVQFDDFTVVDLTKYYSISYVQLGQDSLSHEIAPEAAASYTASCGGTNEPNCGTPPRCNCTSVTETLTSELSATATGELSYPFCHTDETGTGVGTDGSNPGPINGGIPGCECTGAYLGPNEPPCNPCPPPQVVGGVRIPKRCPVEGEGIICSGYNNWIYQGVA